MNKEAEVSGRYLLAERRGRSFALPLTHARGGLPRPRLEPVPLAEPEWLGVMAVRGEVVVVVLADRWLGFDDGAAAGEPGVALATEPAALVLYRARHSTVALAFDRLRSVVSLDAADAGRVARADGPAWHAARYTSGPQAGLVVLDGEALAEALLVPSPVLMEDL